MTDKQDEISSNPKGVPGEDKHRAEELPTEGVDPRNSTAEIPQRDE